MLFSDGRYDHVKNVHSLEKVHSLRDMAEIEAAQVPWKSRSRHNAG